jgi:hypothetical protein
MREPAPYPVDDLRVAYLKDPNPPSLQGWLFIAWREALFEVFQFC